MRLSWHQLRSRMIRPVLRLPGCEITCGCLRCSLWIPCAVWINHLKWHVLFVLPSLEVNYLNSVYYPQLALFGKLQPQSSLLLEEAKTQSKLCDRVVKGTLQSAACQQWWKPVVENKFSETEDLKMKKIIKNSASVVFLTFPKL